MGEPYQGWREPLIRAFRQLRPEASPLDGRKYKGGRVAAIVMKPENSESFMVGARFDINAFNGDSEFTRVTEALIRAHNPSFQRSELTGAPEPYSSEQLKARNGMKIAVTIKTLTAAML